MQEASFSFLSGGRHFSGDDFELNDGKFSTANPWVLEGKTKPVLQQEVVYEGEWAVKLECDSYDSPCSFSLDMNFEIA